eukprot:gene34834-58229_t
MVDPASPTDNWDNWEGKERSGPAPRSRAEGKGRKEEKRPRTRCPTVVGALSAALHTGTDTRQ